MLQRRLVIQARAGEHQQDRVGPVGAADAHVAPLGDAGGCADGDRPGDAALTQLAVGQRGDGEAGRAAEDETDHGVCSSVDPTDTLKPAVHRAAPAALMRASAGQGVGVEVLRPVNDLVRRQIAAGFGARGTARISGEPRSASG
jgi:hypothetical protein